MKLVPTAIAVPPLEAEYQEMVPADAVAANVTTDGPQAVAGVVPVIVGAPLMVATISDLGEAHPLTVNSTQYEVGELSKGVV